MWEIPALFTSTSRWSQVLAIVWKIFLIVGVIDDNSIRQHIKYQIEIATLRSEIEKYRTEYDRDLRILKEMRKGPEVFGKIARERYFMKADNEDIFVLSTDLPGSVEIDENEEDKDSIR